MHSPVRRALLSAGVAASLLPWHAARAAGPLKIGFVFSGPVGDAGWTYQHDLGRRELEKNLGAQVSVRTVPNTGEGPDAERVARELSADGCRLIFGTSFGYMKPMLSVARDNPDTRYLVASGYQTAANFGGYNARWHEVGYLAGIVAGSTTRSNTLGFVGAHPVPDVMWYLNAFALGARSVNPKAVVHVVFIHSWFNPPREQEAAIALMNQGIDVLTHFTDTPAVSAAAEARGVGVIPFDAAMRSHAPKHCLTGIVHNWGLFYTRAAREVIAGTWKPGLYLGGVADGVLKLGPTGPRVSRDVAERVQAKERDIASGKLQVLGGPIKDQKGVVRVAAGAHVADADLGRMDWLADGVVGGSR